MATRFNAKTGLSLAAFAGLIALFQNCGRLSSDPLQSNPLLSDSLPVSSSANKQVVVGDMIFNEDEIIPGKGGGSSNGLQAASGLPTYRSFRWTNGVIPIQFDPTIQNLSRNMFLSACQVWADRTAIRCVLRTDESNYLYVTDDTPNECYSNVGAGYGGQRILNLSDNCWGIDVILHEIGHALGLMHEHQRPDRDQYIQVNTWNIEPRWMFAFDRFQTAGLEQSSYDYDSIMHYDAWAATKNPSLGRTPANATIVAKSPNEAKTATMGRVQTISAGDIDVINKMYPAFFSANIAADRHAPGIFYFRGSNNNLYRQEWSLSNFSRASDMGYRMNGDVTIHPSQPNVLYYRGPANTLHRLEGSASQGWKVWDMGYGINGNVTIHPSQPNVLYYRGATNTLHRLEWSSAQGWKNWDMGYGMNGDVTIDPAQSNVLYYRGATNTLHRLEWSSTEGWKNWDMGYGIKGDVTIHPTQTNILYYRGATDTLHRLEWSSTQGWKNWDMGYGIDGTMTIDPAQPNVLYYRGSTKTLHRLTWSPTQGWRDWDMRYMMSGNLTRHPTRQNVFYYTGASQTVNELSWTPTSGWRNLIIGRM